MLLLLLLRRKHSQKQQHGFQICQLVKNDVLLGKVIVELRFMLWKQLKGISLSSSYKGVFLVAQVEGELGCVAKLWVGTELVKPVFSIILPATGG